MREGGREGGREGEREGRREGEMEKERERAMEEGQGRQNEERGVKEERRRKDTGTKLNH